MSGGFNLSAWAIRHGALTRFLLVLLLGSGIWAYLQLGQKEDPDFTFRVMVVRTLWPGATAQETALQVTDRIEAKLQETPWLDFLRSYSKPGDSVVFVSLRQDIPPREVKEVFYQVRKKVGDIRHTLPEGVVGPFFNDEFGDTYAAIYAFTSDGFGWRELKDRADTARAILQRVPGVAKVDVYGEQTERLWVEIDQTRLATLGLTPWDIQAALAGQNAVEPAGEVVTGERDLRLRITGGLEAVRDLEALPLRVGEASFRLGDVARIVRGTDDPPQAMLRFAGKPAMALGVVMAEDGDVARLGRNLQGALERIRAELPVGIELGQISDQPAVVDRYVFEFLKVLAEAIVIVLVVSFVALGWRTGFVVALSIPLVLAVTFLVMWATGTELQKISLGALIIALGLLVDDAMIAVEMMARKLEEGLDRLSAASFAYTSTAFPMLTGTLITIAGFLPVGLARSVAGEYTFSIFSVVAMALLVSWVVAVWFIPYLGHALLKEHRGAAQHESFDGRFHRALRGFVRACLRLRWAVIGATAVAFVLGVLGLGQVERQFFPSSDRREVMVDLWLPEGTSFARTEHEARRLEAWALRDPDIESVTLWIGQGSPRFYLPLDQELRHSNVAQAVLLTRDLEARERVLMRVRAALASDFPGLRFKAERLNAGPPVGWPVQFRVRGPDEVTVRTIAEQVKARVRQDPDTFNVHDDWHETILGIRLEVDQERARALGVSSQAIRRALAMMASGWTIGTWRDGDEAIPITLRLPEAERSVVGAILRVHVPTGTGGSIPLAQLARPVPVFEDGVIWRRDRMPAVTIRALIHDGLQPPDVAQRIDRTLGDIRAALPLGYSIDIAGALEESEIANASINANMPLMAIVIAVILMIQLQHVGRTILVLLTAPLGIIGAAAAMLVLQAPFGFVAILGVIALSGMIMRNSVILVDQIRQDVAHGLSVHDAIVESTVRRFRPIVLTAAAAVLAMIPLSHSTFWGPMAVAIMGGLIGATLLTVTFLPALYAAWFRVRPAATGAPIPAPGPSAVPAA